MRQHTLNYIKITFFYVIFFAFWRLLFIAIDHPHDFSFSVDAGRSFVNGLKLDISVIGYLLLIHLVLNLIELLLKKKSGVITRNFHRVVIAFLVIINFGNIIIFKFWQSLLNYRAITYLHDPKEMMASLTVLQGILAFVLLGIIILTTLYVFGKIVRTESRSIPIKQLLISIPILVAIVILMIRGGLQQIPINESSIVFTDNRFLNQAAINPAWHLFNEVSTAEFSQENPFKITDEEIAAATVKQLFPEHIPTASFLFKTNRPNIMLVILESHTADLVSALGGENDSPEIDSIIHHGFSFQNVYSSGFRTDQGIVSILNGWPATPYHSIMRVTEKESSLPSLTKIFSSLNYSTTFLYGGSADFSNLKFYCLDQGFQHVIDERVFPKSIPRGQWGVHDEYSLNTQIKILDTLHQPFFSTLMTLSNHEPFDVPGLKHFQGNSMPDRFRNSAAYTDECLKDFLKEAIHHKWYANTLFIFVADHGHHLPLEKSDAYPYSRKIPMVFYGEVIKEEYRGKSDSKLGGHHDLPATLLPQLNLSAKEFVWSKDLLDTNVVSFAYYQIEATIGWMQNNDWIAYSNDEKRFIGNSAKISASRRDSMLFTGQKFTQTLYQDYMQKGK